MDGRELEVILSADRAGQRPLGAELSVALKGAVYPLGRREVVWIARENDAPRSLLTLISALPDRVYRSFDEVDCAVLD